MNGLANERRRKACEGLEAGFTIFAADFRKWRCFSVALRTVVESDADKDVFRDGPRTRRHDEGIRGWYVDRPERDVFDVIVLHDDQVRLAQFAKARLENADRRDGSGFSSEDLLTEG